MNRDYVHNFTLSIDPETGALVAAAVTGDDTAVLRDFLHNLCLAQEEETGALLVKLQNRLDIVDLNYSTQSLIIDAAFESMANRDVATEAYPGLGVIDSMGADDCPVHQDGTYNAGTDTYQPDAHVCDTGDVFTKDGASMNVLDPLPATWAAFAATVQNALQLDWAVSYADGALTFTSFETIMQQITFAMQANIIGGNHAFSGTTDGGLTCPFLDLNSGQYIRCVTHDGNSPTYVASWENIQGPCDDWDDLERGQEGPYPAGNEGGGITLDYNAATGRITCAYWANYQLQTGEGMTVSGGLRWPDVDWSIQLTGGTEATKATATGPWVTNYTPTSGQKCADTSSSVVATWGVEVEIGIDKFASWDNMMQYLNGQSQYQAFSVSETNVTMEAKLAGGYENGQTLEYRESDETPIATLTAADGACATGASGYADLTVPQRGPLAVDVASTVTIEVNGRMILEPPPMTLDSAVEPTDITTLWAIWLRGDETYDTWPGLVRWGDDNNHWTAWTKPTLYHTFADGGIVVKHSGVTPPSGWSGTTVKAQMYSGTAEVGEFAMFKTE